VHGKDNQVPDESVGEYFGSSLYGTCKSVGWKERQTRTLELLLLFASYTCLQFVCHCKRRRRIQVVLYQHSNSHYPWEMSAGPVTCRIALQGVRQEMVDYYS
jgi:hypothetical protein